MDAGCVGKEQRRGIIHLQGIILFLAGLPEVLAPSPTLSIVALLGSRTNRAAKWSVRLSAVVERSRNV